MSLNSPVLPVRGQVTVCRTPTLHLTVRFCGCLPLPLDLDGESRVLRVVRDRTSDSTGPPSSLVTRVLFLRDAHAGPILSTILPVGRGTWSEPDDGRTRDCETPKTEVE